MYFVSDDWLDLICLVMDLMFAFDILLILCVMCFGVEDCCFMLLSFGTCGLFVVAVLLLGWVYFGFASFVFVWLIVFWRVFYLLLFIQI